MRKFISSLAVIFFLFLFVPANRVSAKVITNEEGSVTIAKDEIVNDDLFIGAQSVQIEGVVNGDVFVGAQAVVVNGIVNGTLHAGANTVTINGEVKNNVYIGAGNVTITQTNIGGSLIVGTGNLLIDKESAIGGSILSGGGFVAINAPVERNILVGAGSVEVNSTVGGDVRLAGGNITLGPNAKIAKDLYYETDSDQEISVANTATVAGTINKTTYKIKAPNLKNKERDLTVFRGFRRFFVLLSFLGALVVGLLYHKFFSKNFTNASSTVTKSFWKSLIIGFLITITIIPGLIILLISVIGIPLAGIVFLAFLILVYLSKLVVGLSLGRWIQTRFNWKLSTYSSLALGLLVIYILKFIHIVNPVTTLVVTWVGLGALASNLIQKAK